MEESWPVGTEHVPVENRTRARARIRGLSRSRYSIVVRFDIFSGHVDPPRGQTSFRADVLMTSISPFSSLSPLPGQIGGRSPTFFDRTRSAFAKRDVDRTAENTAGDRDRFDDRMTRAERARSSLSDFDAALVGTM